MRRRLMRQMYLVPVLLALGCPPAAGQPADCPGPGAPVHIAIERPALQELHAAHLKMARTMQPRVLMLGDSITQRFAASPDYRGAWAPISALRTMNMGIGGDRTWNLRWRVENGALEGIAPKVIVILIGVNDGVCRLPPSFTSGAIMSLVEEVRRRQPDAKIRVIGILPSAGGLEWRMAINAALAARAWPEGVRYMQAPPIFEERGALKPEAFAEPVERAIHPSPEGARQLGRWIVDEIAGDL